MEQLSELFYKDPYCKEFSATVVSCEPNKDNFDVVLSDTAFYPEGGGQPSDVGTLSDAVVSHVKRVKGQIRHTVDRELSVGQEVVGKIDWNKRYDNMQNHSGEHIFSGLANKMFGVENIGFHMADDVITVDFDKYLTPEEITRVEEATNHAIIENKSVNISFPSEEEREKLDYRSKKQLTGNVRIVEFPGSDMCACCGTHVSRAGEVGFCKVVNSFKHRGGTRVQFVCGTRLKNYFDLLLRESAACVEKLSAKPECISEALSHLIDERDALKGQLVARTEQLFGLLAQSLPDEETLLVVSRPGLSPLEIKLLCTEVAKTKKTETIAVISEQKPESFNYVIYSVKPDLPKLSAGFNKALNGRGGGRAPTVQGSVNAPEAEIRKYLEEHFGK